MSRNTALTSKGWIVRKMGYVAVFLFFAKLAGAAKEIIVAARFGVAEIVDAYLLVFTLLMWLPIVWTVVLATVYVPLSARLSATELKAFNAELTGTSLLLGGGLCVLAATGLPSLVPYLWSEFDAEGQQNLQRMFRGLAPMIVGVMLAAQYSAQLLAMERHSNTLFDGVPSLMLGLIVLLLVEWEPASTFIFGSLLGVLVQVLGLGLIVWKSGESLKLSFGWRSSGWLLFQRALGVMLVSQLIMGMVTPIDLLVAGYLGEGQIATFGYAHRILLLGMGLGATVVARAILPVLSKLESDPVQAKSLTQQWALIMFALGFIGLLISWPLTKLAVQLLFERGEFSSQDTLHVARVLRAGLIQLPFYFSGVVLVQYFASQQQFMILFWSSLIAFFVKIVTAPLLANWLGTQGIMVSSSVMYLTTLGFLFICFQRVLPQKPKGSRT